MITAAVLLVYYRCCDKLFRRRSEVYNKIQHSNGRLITITHCYFLLLIVDNNMEMTWLKAVLFKNNIYGSVCNIITNYNDHVGDFYCTHDLLCGSNVNVYELFSVSFHHRTTSEFMIKYGTVDDLILPIYYSYYSITFWNLVMQNIIIDKRLLFLFGDHQNKTLIIIIANVAIYTRPIIMVNRGVGEIVKS